jgi:hypothetical protein
VTRNNTETEVGMAQFVSGRQLEPGLIVVSGPDDDDEIMLLAAQECYIPRDVAILLVETLCRRLRVSVTTGGTVVEGPR